MVLDSDGTKERDFASLKVVSKPPSHSLVMGQLDACFVGLYPASQNQIHVSLIQLCCKIPIS